jgi:hypothetical protein
VAVAVTVSSWVQDSRSTTSTTPSSARTRSTTSRAAAPRHLTGQGHDPVAHFDLDGVVGLRRAMAPLIEMLDRLASQSQAPPREWLQRRFREQRAHLQHLVEGADGLGSLLSNMLQAYLTEVSVRQNDDMRRISAWVAIWAVPTLLAGIYGMNFRHMPELDWRFAYQWCWWSWWPSA